METLLQILSIGSAIIGVTLLTYFIISSLRLKTSSKSVYYSKQRKNLLGMVSGAFCLFFAVLLFNLDSVIKSNDPGQSMSWSIFSFALLFTPMFFQYLLNESDEEEC